MGKVFRSGRQRYIWRREQGDFDFTGVRSALPRYRATPDDRAAFPGKYQSFALDKPLPVQLLSYLERLAHGGLDNSYRRQAPVIDLILDRRHSHDAGFSGQGGSRIELVASGRTAACSTCLRTCPAQARDQGLAQFIL